MVIEVLPVVAVSEAAVHRTTAKTEVGDAILQKYPIKADRGMVVVSQTQI